MSDTTFISFRATPAVRRRLAVLQERRGGSRSAAIVSAVIAASTPKGLPPIPDERELLELLSEAARAGNVPAMRELMAYHRERASRTRPDRLDGFDELAARRDR